MKIAIFGGSFNPIHNGHIKIAKKAINYLNLDKLIFVPAYSSPFKKDQKLESSKHRINMIKNSLEDKMEINLFEIKRKGISYTIDTVKYFKNLYKNDELFLIIGSDNLTKLSKWKDINQICQNVQIIVFKRNEKINKTNLKKYNAKLLNNQIFPESSTRFINGNFFDVSDKNRHYIGENKIYFSQILKSTLSQNRYLHSMHAKDFAFCLAKSLNYDYQKASFAAMVHDIAKEINENEARKLIDKFEKNNISIEKYKLHQEVGYIILKHIFNVDDDIANSVRVHTSLAIDLSLLDKIVFMADKLCQGRKWEGIQKIRKLALENFDQAFNLVVKRTREFNLSKNIVITDEQERIYSKWEK